MKKAETNNISEIAAKIMIIENKVIADFLYFCLISLYIGASEIIKNKIIPIAIIAQLWLKLQTPLLYMVLKEAKLVMK
ncbi:hypothetical protein [Metamycoplasma equirhinis]|uniref:hypothetical protein n=1 Tax=Metamycoplasma equirhinis TaxID=92402 RepID=UPI002574249E|nr:hypothetical protein [Metamycoplasma equirhinis]